MRCTALTWACAPTWERRQIGPPGHRWLLIRRSIRTGKLAFNRCHSPRHVPLATHVKVARRAAQRSRLI